jgi:hypothetical protein
MKVKVGDQVYSSENEPIMVILTPEDKERISNMDPEQTLYAACPEGTPRAELERFMGITPRSPKLEVV